MWKNLQQGLDVTLKAAVQNVKEGVKEFKEAALEGVRDLQTQQHGIEDEHFNLASASSVRSQESDGNASIFTALLKKQGRPSEDAASRSSIDSHRAQSGQHIDTVKTQPSSQQPAVATSQATNPHTSVSQQYVSIEHPAENSQSEDHVPARREPFSQQYAEAAGLSKSEPRMSASNMSHNTDAAHVGTEGFSQAAESVNQDSESNSRQSEPQVYKSSSSPAGQTAQSVNNDAGVSSQQQQHGDQPVNIPHGNAAGQATSDAKLQALMEENATIKGAYEEMMVLLKKSMEECVKLSDEVVRLEAQAKSATSAAAAAKKEVSDMASQLSAAKKEAADAHKSADKAEAKLKDNESTQHQASSTTELEVLRSELAAAVQKAMSAVSAREVAEERASLAESAREAAEKARREAERQRRDAEAQAQAAIAAAEAERVSRADIQDQTEALRADQERRARIFNNAVRVAVSRVQQELEGERDELQTALREAQTKISDLRVELRAALEASDNAASEAAARTADAVAAGNLAALAEAAAERSAAREAEAAASLHASQAAKQTLQQELDRAHVLLAESKSKLTKLESQVKALSHDLDRERSAHESVRQQLEEDVARQTQRAETASDTLKTVEKQLEAATAAGIDSAQKSQLTISTLQSRVSELEADIHKMRTSTSVVSSLFQLPTKQDVLAGLGLELVKDDRLRWKSEVDVEQGPTTTAPVPVTRSRTRAAAAGLASSAGAAAGRVLGVVPLRTLLLVGYLLSLHIAVMISFTRSTPDLDKLCAGRMVTGRAADKFLP